MKIEIQITYATITAPKLAEIFPGSAGAVADFFGVVRDLENGNKISALEYEAYSPMAENQMRLILESLAEKHPCLAVTVIHRLGVIPVGETAVFVGVLGRHRGEAFALLAEFMNRFKQDVPIWKIGSRTAELRADADATKNRNKPNRNSALPTLDLALEKIKAHCQPLPAVRANFSQANGRVLRENIIATEDFPPGDKSTRDGFAILSDDYSEKFSIVDILHAADWKPRELKRGEAVRVATGTSLPCNNLRVIRQEAVERTGDTIKILESEKTTNVRQRGEEMRTGEVVLTAGRKLNPGALALLAALGHTQPLVNPRLRVLHFTTGDEIVSPEETPLPGQCRDSNSILIRALLENFPGDVTQHHLPEDFEQAKSAVAGFSFEVSEFDLLLVSGGASVGDKDFTHSLMEWLGFEIIFNRVNIRPGAPLIFGVNGPRAAFGLPGNPLSHFVGFHLFVKMALAKMSGVEPRNFSTGRLAAKLDDAPNSRETLWPARCEWRDGKVELHPLSWSSSGDVAVLAETNALIRLPPNAGARAAGTSIKFLPVHL